VPGAISPGGGSSDRDGLDHAERGFRRGHAFQLKPGLGEQIACAMNSAFSASSMTEGRSNRMPCVIEDGG